MCIRVQCQNLNQLRGIRMNWQLCPTLATVSMTEVLPIAGLVLDVFSLYTVQNMLLNQCKYI
jgi:hypothetical protein